MRAFLLLLLMISAPVMAQQTANNAALTRIFDTDQGDRAAGLGADASKVATADMARRERVRAMLDGDGVRTGLDYYHAAFVFQHGLEPRDYLLAHVLAVTAVGKGVAAAGWIAAATLDRYLDAIGQPQVYGTQFHFPKDSATTQEPYDRTLLGDAQRAVVDVPPIAAQAARVKTIDAERARLKAHR